MSNSTITKNNTWRYFWLFLLSIGLALLLAFSFHVYKIFRQGQEIQNKLGSLPPSIPSAQLSLLKGTDKNPSLGDDKAPITLVIFADFSCPICQSAFPKLRELAKKQPDKVRLVYRDFPFKTDFSLDQSLAGRCAHDQGLFWSFHDRLYLRPNSSSRTDLLNTAESIGADRQRFEKCLQSQTFLTEIRRDIDDAGQLGISGTPTIFVNNYRIDGEPPYDYLDNIINTLLEN